MLDLALNKDNGLALLKDIALRQDISQKYIWHIMDTLKAAGLVNSVRGSRGGYILAKAPEQITLKDILSVLEGSMCLVDCVESPSLCKRSSFCVTRDVWGEVTQRIRETLAIITLDQMVKRHNHKNGHLKGGLHCKDK